MTGIDRAGWTEATPEHPLGALWRALRAHPVLATLVVLATVGGALAWLALRTPEYRATAQVLVNPRPQDDELFLGLSVIKDTGDPTRTIQTAAALLESPDAARMAAGQLGPQWSGQDVLGAIEIQPQGESNILDAVAAASSPEEATRIANAFVDAALEVRDRTLRRQVEPIIERSTQARAELGPAEADTATELARRITQLRDLQTDGDPTMELARRATLPSAPEGASSSLILVLAIAAGVVLAAVVTLVAELLGPPRVTTELQLAKLTRVPVLARVPSLRRWIPRGRSRTPPPLPRASLEAFRTLRLQLELTLDNEPKVVMLTSPSTGDGKTTSVVQFGQTLAAAGNRVLLVDLDFGRPRLADALGVMPELDLLDVINGDTRDLSPYVDVPGQPGLALMVASRSPAGVNADEVAGSLQDVVMNALEEFPYVLLDTPALTEVSDALKLASVADAVLLVVRLGRTTVADLEIADDLLERTRRHSAGFIVVGAHQS